VFVFLAGSRNCRVESSNPFSSIDARNTLEAEVPPIVVSVSNSSAKKREIECGKASEENGNIFPIVSSSRIGLQ
jgi:hypothetical protein